MIHDMRLRAALAGSALALAAVFCACAPPPNDPKLQGSRGEALVRRLADPATRDAAFCGLIALGLYHRPSQAYPETCRPVSEVVTAPQAESLPLYMAFSQVGVHVVREPIRRGPAGVFTIFDSLGYVVPAFSGANLIAEEGELLTDSSTGMVAVASVFGVAGGRVADDQWSVRTLNIIPVTAAQHSVLSIALGPPTFGLEDSCAGAFWSWRYVAINGEREIQIGPRSDGAGNITVAAIFRWSNADQRYVGPSGGNTEQFLQFDPNDVHSLGAYADGWRSRQDERTGHRLSWCQTTTFDASGVP